MTKNKHLNKAKKGKNDEFYTQYVDIENELSNYDANLFKDKVIYCNCDNPYESNFVKYFIFNFKRLELKSLICVNYNNELKGRAFVINRVIDDVDKINTKDLISKLKDDTDNVWLEFEGNGDFRSEESIEFLKQSDIVITNPPFSLFREYIKQLIDYNKKFLIIANINAITYKEVFPLIKENKVWLGTGMGRWISGFIVPKSYELYGSEARVDEEGNRIVATNNCLWFTNLDHNKRHQLLPLRTMSENIEFSSHKKIKEFGYKKYDNFDALEVPYTDAIPSDYNSVMGVPVTFLDKYNPEQFEIVGCSYDYGRPDGWNENINMSVSVEGKNVYKRILIKRR